MDYKRGQALAGAEFALLQIIEEKQPVSGYEINKLIEDRGYRQWTDIGTTSIYVGLEKLSRKGLTSVYLDTGKKGKGPAPKKYRLTEK